MCKHNNQNRQSKNNTGKKTHATTIRNESQQNDLDEIMCAGAGAVHVCIYIIAIPSQYYVSNINQPDK